MSYNEDEDYDYRDLYNRNNGIYQYEEYDGPRYDPHPDNHEFLDTIIRQYDPTHFRHFRNEDYIRFVSGLRNGRRFIRNNDNDNDDDNDDNDDDDNDNDDDNDDDDDDDDNDYYGNENRHISIFNVPDVKDNNGDYTWTVYNPKALPPAKGGSCSICMEDFDKNSIVVSHGLNSDNPHQFHNHCINRWYYTEEKHECPYDRQRFGKMARNNQMLKRRRSRTNFL